MSRMKVFVSSTTSGLGSYRKAVADQLWDHRIEPIHQEDGHLDFGTIRSILKSRILMCDAVICLIGPVFGTAPDQPGVYPPRSYTQLEYDMALELKKRIFVLVAHEKCKLDVYDQEDTPKPAWQEHFIKELGDLRYEFFENMDELRKKIGRFVGAISAIAQSSRIFQIVDEEFPTPLTEYFKKRYEHSGLDLGTLTKVLTFVSLLAARDLQQCGEMLEAEALKIQSVRDCCNLLADYSATDEGKIRPRFIAPLIKWHIEHGEALEHIIRDLRNVASLSEAGDLSDADREVNLQKQRANLELLYEWLMFLRTYVLVGIDSSGMQGKAIIHLFRGNVVQTVAVELADGTVNMPYEMGMYLISLSGQHLALPLWPLIWRLSTKPYTLLGWRNSDKDNLTLVTFGDGGPICVKYEKSTHSCPISPIVLFSEDAWQKILKLVLPLHKREELLIPGYLLDNRAFYHGSVADIYLAVPQSELLTEGNQKKEAYAVHVLRDEFLKEPDVRHRFAEWANMWHLLEHSHILSPHVMNASVSSTQPTLAVRHIDTHCSMLDRTQIEGSLPNKQLVTIMEMAADVCQEAHRNQLCVLSLPLRHLLIDHDGRIHFTGFDTIWRQENELPSRDKLYRLFKKDHEQFAPEIRNGGKKVDISADIYALGVLLCSLRAGDGQYCLDFRSWRSAVQSNDSWKYLLFHCLVEDSYLRFRSMEQFKEFLLKWCTNDREPIPETVALYDPSLLNVPFFEFGRNSALSLSIGKYPVTNVEYEYFCIQEGKGRSLPMHSERLQGPFLPVVGVNLIDAYAYCHWLTMKTGKTWRLPYEKEWLHAAGALIGDKMDNNQYNFPWGSESCEGRANYDYLFGGPTVVGAFSLGISPFGCYDMVGNVWEWCIDRIPNAPLRVLKGGSYQSAVHELNISNHRAVLVAYRSDNTGFRVVCEG
jgi:hypothetical protein